MVSPGRSNSLRAARSGAEKDLMTESSGLPISIRLPTNGGVRAVIVATSLTVVVAAVFLLAAASPATANGVTFPVAAGASGPYEYQVGVGPYSPLRKAMFVAVTLMVDGSPVIDADVTLRASVDGSSTEVGPLNAVNSPIHPWTYEISFELPDLAREKVVFNFEVKSRHGPAVIRAEMIVPRVDDSVLMTSKPTPSDETPDPAKRARGPDQDGPPPSVGLAYLGIALVAGLFGFGLGAWGLTRYRRRRS